MFVRQHIFLIVTQACLIVLFFVFATSVSFAQTKSDSTKVLKEITVSEDKKPVDFTTAVPVQLLDNATLQQINAESVADAAKYFSGVLIKDYGGVGGLETISVRSLGALNTGLLYDGIPVADAQTGEIDLSKFSSTFVQTLELDEANPQQILLPARAYSSASVLAITTNTFNTTNFSQEKWSAGIKQGSFGLWQPFAGLYFPTKKNIVISATAEAIWSKGNYPYYINNGSFSQNAVRANSDVKSWQGELNIVKQFSDSSRLQTKVWTYNAERELPPAIVLFYNNSAQRLSDDDVFVQSRYEKKINPKTGLLVSLKYSNMFTRYVDPDFAGGSDPLDDRYIQQEWYGSVAVSHSFGKYLAASFASDMASTGLVANIKNFSNPTRLSLWNSIALQYNRALWQINGSLLNTNVNEQTQIGPAAVSKNIFTPTIAGSYKTKVNSPLLFRAFYKNIFRLPTFNDVYYTYIASINPKLSPEYSEQYDAGITYSQSYHTRISQFSISVDGYYNDVRDKIISIPVLNLFEWTTTNLGKVHIIGVDVNAALKGNISSTVQGSLRVAYTWQQAQDVTDPTQSVYKNEIPYAPQNSGSAVAVAFYRRWSAGYNLLYSGIRYSLGDNNASDELNGWATHDLFITRAIKCSSLGASIKAEVDNIFNNYYQVIQDYPMPGRLYKISITFNNL